MTTLTKLSSPPQLKGLDFSAEEIKRARKESKMLVISIETSNICNLRCIYCYTDACKKLPNELTLDEYKNVFDQAVELGAKEVAIAGAGEPLLDPNFFKILNLIEERGLYLILYTNATLIGKTTAKRLYDSPVTAVATLNSIRPEVQNKLCGGIPWAYERMMQGIHNLMDAGFNKTNPTRIAIDSFVVKETINEAPDIFRFARKNNIFPYICRIFLSGRAKGKDLDITNEQFRDLTYKLLEIDETEFGYTWVPRPPFVASQCQLVYINMVVGIQGDVRPCYSVFINAGNIRKHSLKDIWNSNFLRDVRNMEANLKGKCGSCELKGECFGCRCRTFAMTGDVFASDPACWR
jgi:radical SAM protein with 4Fe4S-binding SPASM domain